jgi:hypothetical protein
MKNAPQEIVRSNEAKLKEYNNKLEIQRGLFKNL